MPIDPRKLRSQRLRSVNYQGDALRRGMNWTEEDLAKPQVLVDSAYGMGHPGTFHFRPLIEEVSNGVFEASSPSMLASPAVRPREDPLPEAGSEEFSALNSRNDLRSRG